MKKATYLFFTLISSLIFGQKNNEYSPIEIREIKTDFTDEFVQKYNSEESLKKCNEIWNKLSAGTIEYNDLEKESLKYCDEFGGNPWSKLPTGCSWYCGGIVDTIYSSSKKFTKNIHDFDYGIPWISEETNQPNLMFIEYVFKPESSRVTDIIFVNGNVKSKELFEEYSRAKTIKMYINNKPFAILHLKDIKNEQVFRFKPIGTKKRKNYEKMKTLPKWSIKFEIVAIYKGKNNSIAISEIYFEGEGDGHEDFE